MHQFISGKNGSCCSKGYKNGHKTYKQDVKSFHIINLQKPKALEYELITAATYCFSVQDKHLVTKKKVKTWNKTCISLCVTVKLLTDSSSVPGSGPLSLRPAPVQEK